MEPKYFKLCRVRCRHCDTILEWRNSSKSDCGSSRPLMCACGKVGLDPSALYYRILGNETDWEDLSVEWED